MAKVSDNWPTAWGPPVCTASFKLEPEHFRVTELSDLKLSGSGDYLYLWVEKKGFDTHSVVMDLSRAVGIKPRDIGYSGRKDKQAVTRQWFSLYVPGGLSGHLPAESPNYKILKTDQHVTGLSSGQHAGNQFKIRLTDVNGDRDAIEERLESIKQSGFPNYFGDQRFGSKYQNLTRGRRMLAGKLRVRERNQRSLYLSACRSFLFNEVLAERIRQDSWRNILPGDMGASPELYWPQTMSTYDSEMNGPLISLYGDGDSVMSGETKHLEEQVYAMHQELCDGIRSSRVEWSTRPAVMFSNDLTYEWDNVDLILRFSLSKGAFATALLSEIVAELINS